MKKQVLVLMIALQLFGKYSSNLRGQESGRGHQLGPAVRGRNEPRSARELKEELRLIAQRGYDVPSPDDRFRLTLVMARYIGVSDPELRDRLIWRTFKQWIVDDNRFRPEQLRALLRIATDGGHLFYHLGEHETDSVFTRAFSALVVEQVLIAHRRKPFLTTGEIEKTKTDMLRYLRGERDLRGMVPVKGWAHAVAHAADALDQLAQATELDRTGLLELLDVIQEAASASGSGYLHGEDERLVTAVVSVLKRNLLTNDEVTRWVQDFVPARLEDNYQLQNRKNFLRSLYFRLLYTEPGNSVSETVVEALRQISRLEGTL